MNVWITRPLLAFLAVITLLAALRPTDGLLLPALAAAAWAAVLRLHLRRSHWQGAALFALVWLDFVLLKAVNANWVAWHADGLLARWDSALWGGRILPSYFRYEAHPLAADWFALCYFCFFLMVLWAVCDYACRRRASSDAFFNGLLAVYLLGLTGYFALPAAGPAFTTLPDTGTPGLFAPALLRMVADGVTGMDVFPSLHTALPLYITAFLWRDGRRRTAVLLLPLSLCIVAATILLRYHYGVDVLAGILLAAAAAWRFAPSGKREKAA